jgi:arginase family enzyme
MSSSGMRIYPMSSLRTGDVAGVVGSAVSSVADRSDWIACHLDVDSLDPTIMPAVNFPESGGLTLGEAKTIVRAVQGTGKFKLFELAGYNPDLDADRTCARKLVEFVSDVFQPIH